MKGLAVTQIVLLVLGIVVLAIIGYLLYTTFIGTKPVIEQQCKSAFISVCSNCKAAGWTGDPCKFPTIACNTTSVQDAVGAHPTTDGYVQQTECNAVGVI